MDWRRLAAVFPRELWLSIRITPDMQQVLALIEELQYFVQGWFVVRHRKRLSPEAREN